MSKLTPVLSANWDDKDSFTIEGYKRAGGYQSGGGGLSPARRSAHRRQALRRRSPRAGHPGARNGVGGRAHPGATRRCDG